MTEEELTKTISGWKSYKITGGDPAFNHGYSLADRLLHLFPLIVAGIGVLAMITISWVVRHDPKLTVPPTHACCSADTCAKYHHHE